MINLPFNKKLSVLLIGLGRIGYSKDEKGAVSSASHLGAILGNDSFDLVFVCDPRKDLLDEVDKNFGISGFSSLKQIPSDHKFDLIVIASPSTTHFQVMTEALRFDPKMFFVEKPLTKLLHETPKIIKLCSDNEVQISVNFSRRFSTMYQNFYNIIKSQTSDKNILLNARFTGTILNNGIHFIDLALFFFGKPEQIEVLKTNGNLIRSFSFSYPKLKTEVIFVCLGNLSASVEEIDLFIGESRIMIDNFEAKKRSQVPDSRYPGFKVFSEEEQLVDDSYNALVLAYKNITDWFLFRSERISPCENTILLNSILEEYLSE